MTVKHSLDAIGRAFGHDPSACAVGAPTKPLTSRQRHALRRKACTQQLALLTRDEAYRLGPRVTPEQLVRYGPPKFTAQVLRGFGWARANDGEGRFWFLSDPCPCCGYDRARKA